MEENLKDTQNEVTQETETEAEVETVEDIETTLEPKKEQETVPLSVFLELKNDLKELRKELKDAPTKAAEKEAYTDGVRDIFSKYPTVDREFIEDVLKSAEINAISKIEGKYAPIIERQEADRKQAVFNTAFDNLYNKVLADNPELPDNIDKDVVKTLAISPKYKNTPLAEIITSVYGGESKGKQSSENDTRPSSDIVVDSVEFDKMDEEQKGRVMSDPKARQKYFDWLDTQPGR